MVPIPPMLDMVGGASGGGGTLPSGHYSVTQGAQLGRETGEVSRTLFGRGFKPFRHAAELRVSIQSSAASKFVGSRLDSGPVLLVTRLDKVVDAWTH